MSNCDWCDKKERLYKEGKAMICLTCQRQHILEKENPNRTRGKWIKAFVEDFEKKTMSEKTYSNYLKNQKKTPVIGHIE